MLFSQREILNVKEKVEKRAEKRPVSLAKKVLVIGGLLFVLGLAGLFGLYRFYRYYQSPARFVEQARELAARGEYEAASDQYRRALRQTRSPSARVEILEAMVDNMSRGEPDVPDRMHETSRTILGLYGEIVRLSEDRDQPVRRSLEASFRIAENLNSPGFWRELEQVAQLVLRLDGGNRQARKYLNISRLFTRQPEQRTERFFNELLDEFIALSEDDDDPDLVYYRALAMTVQAGTMDQEYMVGRRRGLLDRAVALLEEYVAEHPEDARMRVRSLRIAMQRLLNTRDQGYVAHFVELIEEPWRDLGEEPERATLAAYELAQIYFMVSQFAGGRVVGVGEPDFVFTVDGDEMQRRAVSLLQSIAGDDLVGLRALHLLARIERGAGDRESALAAVDRMLAEDVKFMPGPEVVVAWSYQLQARFMRIDMWLEDYEESGDGSIMERVEHEISGMQERIGEENPYVQLMLGRVAYLRGEYRRAVGLFESAESTLGATPQSLLFSGLSLFRLGETGAALRRLGEYVRTPGQDARQRRQALEALAESAVRLRHTDQAVEIRRRLVAEYPDWPQARLGLVQTLILRGRLGGGIERETVAEIDGLLEPLVAVGDATAVEQAVHWYLQTERVERAEELLVAFQAENPEIGWANSLLYSVWQGQGREDEARRLAEQVVEMAPAGTTRDYLRKALADEDGWGDYRVGLLNLALQDDEVRRQTEVYQLLRQLQRTEEARQVLRDLERSHGGDPRVMELRFVAALAEQEWAKAEAIVGQAMAEPETEVFGEQWKARLEIVRGNPLAAVSRLERLVDRGESSSSVLTLLGVAHEQRGDLGQAQERLEEALALRPDSLETVRQLISVTAARGFNHQAMNYMRHALRLAPQDEQMVRNFLNHIQEFESSEQALRLRLQLAQMNPGDRENRLQIANLYLRNRRFEEASELLRELRAEAPEDFVAVLLTARMMAMTERVEQGRELLRAFLEMRGDAAGAMAWTQYAEFLEQTGAESSEVVEALEQGRALEEERNPIASRYLASLRARVGDTDDSLRRFAQLHRQTGDNAYLLQMAELNHEAGDYQRARQHLDAYLERERMTARVGLLQARIQIAENQPAAALSTLDRVINLAPGLAEGYLFRAQLLWENESLRRSGYSVRQDLQKALEADRNLAQARYLLALWLAENQRREEAIEHLRQLLVRHPANSQYRDRLARLYMAEGAYSRLRSMIDEWAGLASEADSREALLALWWRARLDRAMGNRERALEHFAVLYEKAPGDVGVVNDYLGLLLEMQSYDRVIAMVKGLPDELRDRPGMQLVAAQAMAATGEEEGALVALVDAFSKGRADVGFQNRVLEVAQRHLSEDGWRDLLPMLTPYDSGRLTDLFRAAIDYERGEWARAAERLQGLRTSLDRESPAYVRALMLLAASLSKQGRHAEAESVLNEAVAVVPDNPVILNNLAYEVATIGDRPFRAVELAERALANVAADNVEIRAHILDTLGYAQHLAGLLAYAETSLQRSLRERELPSAYLNLGRVYLGQQRPREALRVLRQALEKAPEAEVKLREDAARLIAQAEAELAQTEAN